MSSDINELLSHFKKESDQNAVTTQLDLSRLPQAELNKQFIDSLYKAGVTATWKFRDVERTLSSTPIWNAIKGFKEKRNLFNEFIKNFKTREKEEIKLRKEKLRQKFKKMLEEDPTITSNSKYADAIARFAYDERWRSLDDKDREEMFQDYIDDLYERENKLLEEKRRKQREILINLLKDMQIPVNTTWKDINFMLKTKEEFNTMFKIDQLTAFEDYILALEKEERAKKKEEEKYLHYQNREKFRDLLQTYLDEGKISMNTKWKNFAEEIQNKEEYINLLLQPGSTPREIFMDLINTLKTDYKMNKKILKKILKENNIKFECDITFEKYEETLEQFQDYKLIRERVKPILYEHLIKKLQEKEAEKNNRELKIAKKILKYINNKKININEKDDFSIILRELRKLDKFDNVSDESLQKGYELMLKLKGKYDEDKMDSDD